MLNILFASVAGFTLFCALCLAIVLWQTKQKVASNRLSEVLGQRQHTAGTFNKHSGKLKSSAKRTMEFLQRFGIRHSLQTQEKLHAAGLRTIVQMDSFLAAQWLTPIAGLFAGSFIRTNTLFACVLLTAVGYILPGLWLQHRIRTHKEKIRRSLPDALDLLNICMEAGLGLDQAIIRVSGELTLSHPELHAELHRVQLEQRVSSNRLDAWKRLAARADIDEISAFVSMLAQSERFGTPIARALSRFADDLRIQRRQRAEEAAAKTRVKIVFPLVFFIFPCLFLVLLAPAVIGLMGVLKDLR